MDTLVQFFQDSVEVREFGWNTGTIGAFGIVLITFVQVWGIVLQARTIRTRKSGDGVSIIFNTFLFFELAALLIYAVEKKSLSMAFNATLVAASLIPLVHALMKYRWWKPRETFSLFFVFPFIPVLMWVLETKGREIYLFLLLLGILAGLWQQFREFRAAPGLGGFDVRFAYAFMLASVFWFMFSLAINDWVLIIFNPVAGAIWVTIYVEYRKKLRSPT